jgi:hypothetical protein
MARSITDDPVAAADEWNGFPDKIAAYIAAARLAAADGLTWTEFGELLIALLRLTIAAVDTYGMTTGHEKKAMVMEAVAMLFDAVADRAVPTIAKPLWYVARPAVRSLVLSIADGAVEVVLPLVRG